MFEFMSGLIVAGFLISGLFFLRFWKRTGDLLFMAFALAFWLLALNQILLVISELPYEERSWIYLLRLAAFTLIIVAIIRKNRRA
jgi:hypothetical protein